MTTFTQLSKYIIFACIFTQAVLAYSPKTVIYWGQESQGKEKSLRTYCDSGDYGIIVMGFVYEFPVPSDDPDSAYPALNFASHCETPFNSSHPHTLNCPGIGADVTYCQSIGVQILLSFGGGVGRYGFTSDAQAITFANLVWNMFFEGTDSSIVRPFGSAIIDGVDLDIEGGGITGYVAFISTLRSYYAASARKNYYISSAPQCFYPDGRLGPGAGTALSAGWFDYVFVQFYNNYCGLEFTPYLTVPQFNFNTWANWARTGSVNPNVKVFIGAPASKLAVGAGFVTIDVLSSMASTVQKDYSDVYGGIMLWDASNSDNNNNFGHLVAAFVRTQAGVATVVQSPPVASPPTVVAPATTATTTAAAPMTTAAIKPATTAAMTTATIRAPIPVTTATTTAAAAPATTAAAAPVTNPAATPVTTAVKASIAATTAAVAAAIQPVPSTTAAAKASVPVTTAASVMASSPSTPCTPGYMKCLTSETYSMCNRGSWGASQSCQHGLTCTPTGNFIYCT